MDASVHAAEIVQSGFTIMESLLPTSDVLTLRAEAQRRRNNNDIYIFGAELFRTLPELVLPLVGTPRVLDVAEKLMGPFVQLDSFSVIGVPSGCPADISWHRDPYGSVPRGYQFQRPMAINLLVYLQHLNDENGPLRVIPRSHRSPTVMNSMERLQPHPNEQLIHVSSGDGVLIHNNLIHSRSKNKSSSDRTHISVIYNLTCMRPTLNLDGSVIRNIVSEIEKSGNRRFLRLFGKDALALERYNSGFMQPDEMMWAAWLDSERTNVW